MVTMQSLPVRILLAGAGSVLLIFLLIGFGGTNISPLTLSRTPQNSAGDGDLLADASNTTLGVSDGLHPACDHTI